MTNLKLRNKYTIKKFIAIEELSRINSGKHFLEGIDNLVDYLKERKKGGIDNDY